MTPTICFLFSAVMSILAGAALADGARITNADKEPGNWMSYGRDYAEQRFSPLDQINLDTVAKLGLAWSYDFDEFEPIESTPLVVDGVMYVTSSWSKVYALDAVTGKELWRFDPEVDRSRLVYVCCNAVNRGVAWWNGKVYVATIDGRLIALDARSGKVVWSKLTIDLAKPYSITGAPRVAKGKVFIGNAGADIGVRGYVTAYDAETGEQVWRFYAVPGNPADGFENKAMEMAAKTWTGEWWTWGGGGTAWDSIVYDQELDLVYLGFGNAAPWNQHIRSPGGGDNLFVASIVAVKPDTGDYVWHYQVNPGETWDYSASMPMMLATLPIQGKPRKVLMQAPKNGFFYVIDRETGKLISATAHAFQNWAKGFDQKTGRPIEAPNARYPDGKAVFVGPSAAGATNWQPMSFNPKTGLVYLQSRDNGQVYVDDPAYAPTLLSINNGNGSRFSKDASGNPIPWPTDRVKSANRLVAWDPVAQKEVWKVDQPISRGNGTLSTAGGLVFQGRSDGTVRAYDATTGRDVWSHEAQNNPVAPPMSYSVGGEQYVAFATGWGYATMTREPVAHPNDYPNTNRVLVFKLGATGKLTAINFTPPPLRKPPTETVNAALVEDGANLYDLFCSICHGGNAGGSRTRPDLRFSDYLDNGDWNTVVLEGALKVNGMAAFAPVLTPAQSEAIRAYVISQAQKGPAAVAAPAPMPHQQQ